MRINYKVEIVILLAVVAALSTRINRAERAVSDEMAAIQSRIDGLHDQISTNRETSSAEIVEIDNRLDTMQRDIMIEIERLYIEEPEDNEPTERGEVLRLRAV